MPNQSTRATAEPPRTARTMLAVARLGEGELHGWWGSHGHLASFGAEGNREVGRARLQQGRTCPGSVDEDRDDDRASIGARQRDRQERAIWGDVARGVDQDARIVDVNGEKEPGACPRWLGTAQYGGW